MNQYLNNITIILPHILITVIILIIPFSFGYSNLSSLESIIFKITGPLTVLLAFYLNYIRCIDLYLFNKKYIQFITINAIFITLVFSMYNSHTFKIIKDEHFRLEREQIILEYENDTDKKMPSNFEGRIKRKESHKHKLRENINSNHLKKRGLFGIFFFQLLGIFTAIGIKYGKRAKTEESKRKDIEAAYLKSKNDLLRYQLQPHFFFNTLNSIHYLIDTSTKKAKDTLLDLSQLMRYVLNVSEKEYVNLDDEINFLIKYCDLMKLRTADDLDFVLKIENTSISHEIAPLLLIVLVENAFKHGISGRDEDYIHIILDVNQTQITFTLENSKYNDQLFKTKDLSIGLENLKTRLALLYPEKHQLKVVETESMYKTILILEQ